MDRQPVNMTLDTFHQTDLGTRTRSTRWLNVCLHASTSWRISPECRAPRRSMSSRA
ncbi:hypothetical protein J2793_007015 [Paraburkholderia caledonica]|uniref:Uncharacterized protein n=1 Tax=Paraburkholderia caledonica TaxID=134536 RepID=A0AB73INF6_9BURK|nr:hypothetical protein [Paraburkholderia caledonica]